MPREKKVRAFKGKKLNPRVATGSSNVPAGKASKVKADQADAAKKLATRDVSTNELAALMQEAPGGARPDQIRPTSRQFKSAVDAVPNYSDKNASYDT